MLRSFISDFLALLIVGAVGTILWVNRDDIVDYLDTIFYPQEKIIVKASNQYARNYDYEQFQITEDFVPKNKDDLLNIFYTILNSGWESFFFYCPEEYAECENDINVLAKDEEILSSINNYVSPYNSYVYFAVTINSYGKVTITPSYTYSKEMIDTVENKITSLESQLIGSNMSVRDKIRTFHDYVINHTKYDTVMVNSGTNNYKANTAYGPLLNGYGICGGYSDAMALFLDDLKIPNYKIASDNHVWNYVLLDGKWYHLDLTWDDPVSMNGENRLIYTYFLITDDQLKKLNTSGNHTYNEDYY